MIVLRGGALKEQGWEYAVGQQEEESKSLYASKTSLIS